MNSRARDRPTPTGDGVTPYPNGPCPEAALQLETSPAGRPENEVLKGFVLCPYNTPAHLRRRASAQPVVDDNRGPGRALAMSRAVELPHTLHPFTSGCIRKCSRGAVRCSRRLCGPSKERRPAKRSRGGHRAGDPEKARPETLAGPRCCPGALLVSDPSPAPRKGDTDRAPPCESATPLESGANLSQQPRCSREHH